MGGGQSSSSSERTKPTLGKNLQDIVKLMMPVYYTLDPITPDEHSTAQKSWEMILSNTAPGFLEQRKSSVEFSRKFTTSIMYFSDCFYARLFDVHPMARNLFRDMKSQGKFLVKMISLSLSEVADAEKFTRTLEKLAEIHNERGVKAVECEFWQLFLIYGILVIPALFYRWYCR